MPQLPARPDQNSSSTPASFLDGALDTGPLRLSGFQLQVNCIQPELVSHVDIRNDTTVTIRQGECYA
jgi:hypothetical protein